MTVKVPESVKAAFTAHPEATLAMRAQDMGHGYGKANRMSRCGLTGDWIVPGEVIRHVAVWTTAGRCWDGVISNRAVGYLFGARSYEHTDEDENRSTVCIAVHHKCAEGWEAILETATPGTRLHLIQRTNHTHTDVIYTLGTDGKWLKGRSTAQSMKQLQATLKRSKRSILWQLRTAGR